MICRRGVITPSHTAKQKARFCLECKYFYSEDYWTCVELRELKKLGEANKL